MENIPDDELISAYLDGELTGKDLARAEQLLASQADSRQMLDELTALRASLKALPQQRLGRDFAESVLRRAEREMLQPAGNKVAAIEAAALPTPVDTWRPEVPPILSMSRWTRPLVWAALTTAAAIMIMMFSPPDARQKVALAPKVADGPAPADLAMQARDVDAPQDNAMIAADAVHGDPAPRVAGREPAQNHFFAGPDSAARGGRVNPTPESFRMDVAGGDDALLVVLCDVTPEVASSARFRRLLAEQQIPWQEVQAGGKASDGQTAFAAQESAGPGKEADAPPADKSKQAEPASVTKDEVAADASKPLPAESGATPPSTEAVYVVAAPSQVNATIAAIAGKSEYRNLQMKELTGPLPHELLAGMREHRGEAPELDAAQQNAAQPLAATADSARERSRVSKRNLAKSEEGTDRADAPQPPMSSRMATTAAAAPGAANAPGAADAVTLPLAVARPAIAHAEPALLSSATIAELSRAVDPGTPGADEKASGEQGQPSEQALKDEPFDKQSSNEKQSVAGNGINRQPGDGNAVDDEARRNKSDGQKDGAKEPSQQQKLPLGQSAAAQDGDGDGSLGGSQMRSGKAVRGNLKAGPKKLDAQDVKDSAAPKPNSGRDQNSPKTMAAPTDPRPVAAPARAEPFDASPASPAPAASSPPAPAKVPAPVPAPGAAGSKPTELGKNAGAVEEPLHDELGKPDSTKSLEAVLARRAIFLFRVVPAPAAEPQR
jgi:hypothetical protein